jgi:hypothetical protein
MRAATPVNAGVATRNAIGIEMLSEAAAGIAGRPAIPPKLQRRVKNQVLR